MFNSNYGVTNIISPSTVNTIYSSWLDLLSVKDIEEQTDPVNGKIKSVDGALIYSS